MKDNCLLDSKKMERNPGAVLHFVIVDLLTYFTSSKSTSVTWSSGLAPWAPPV